MKSGAIVTDDPFLYPIHLQEARDWRKMLQARGTRNHVRVELVALCRQWSERLASHAPMSSSANGTPVPFVDLPAWLSTLNYRPEWRWVLRVYGPPPDHLSIDEVRAELDTYINESLLPSTASGPGWYSNILMERFLVVSVAFDVVARDAPDDTRITLLATTTPGRPPDFDGYDLWLQRRALRFCAARHGVSFITTHLSELRVEAIISLILSDLFSYGDLQKIEESLKDYTYRPMNLEIGDLLEALDVKRHSLNE